MSFVILRNEVFKHKMAWRKFKHILSKNGLSEKLHAIRFCYRLAFVQNMRTEELWTLDTLNVGISVYAQ